MYNRELESYYESVALTGAEDLVEIRAKELYYIHMKLDPVMYDFMWGQCSLSYKNAWRYIAFVEICDL